MSATLLTRFTSYASELAERSETVRSFKNYAKKAFDESDIHYNDSSRKNKRLTIYGFGTAAAIITVATPMVGFCTTVETVLCIAAPTAIAVVALKRWAVPRNRSGFPRNNR